MERGEPEHPHSRALRQMREHEQANPGHGSEQHGGLLRGGVPWFEWQCLLCPERGRVTW